MLREFSPEMLAFLQRQFVLSLAVSFGEKSWSANCFYLFDPAQKWLVITTEDRTLHAQIMQQNPQVSGTIAYSTLNIAAIEGVQFLGRIAKISADLTPCYQQKFFEKFQSARVFQTPMWAIELDLVKYTANQPQFGTKQIWQRHFDQNLLESAHFLQQGADYGSF